MIPACQFGSLSHGKTKRFCQHPSIVGPGNNRSVPIAQCQAAEAAHQMGDPSCFVPGRPPVQQAHAMRPVCIHRGEPIGGPVKTCCGNPGVQIHACTRHEKCADEVVPLSNLQALHEGYEDVTACSQCPDRQFSRARWVTGAQLMADTLLLIPKLPRDCSGIIGVPRSGMSPATLLAQMLHLPLWTIGHDGLTALASGWRLAGSRTPTGPKVLIDDTCMTGGSLVNAKALASGLSDLITATIYCNPEADQKPDLFAVALPWPHLLEWNLFNSVLLPSMAVDFDGILCDDPTPPYDGDEDHYLRFLEHASPKYLIRKQPIPLIVTARLEKYRPQTEAWLDRHGVRVDRLMMFPADDLHERNRQCIASWKADIFRNWVVASSGGLQPKLFVESDDRQARIIAERSGFLTVCPTSGECYG